MFILKLCAIFIHPQEINENLPNRVWLIWSKTMPWKFTGYFGSIAILIG
jgi:hypothetical protein